MSLADKITFRPGDLRLVVPTLEENSVDAVVTDPPYHLVSITKRFGKPGAAAAKGGPYKRHASGFMGKEWDGTADGGIAFDPATWAHVLRAMKPGAHLVAFGGTRTYHRMACAIEDAGFEIRDQLGWLYGSGFPKSHDVSKGIDRVQGAKGEYGDPKSTAHAGWIERGRMRGSGGHEGYQRPWMQNESAVDQAARQYIPATAEAAAWDGWGTAIKPAWEPIVLARKPLSQKTVAANVRRWGTGALNIDACRIPILGDAGCWGNGTRPGGFGNVGADSGTSEPSGRKHENGRWPANVITDGSDAVLQAFPEARFFYCAKAGKAERLGSRHPTVKPIALLAYLCRLITPPGGLVLDPFAGTGTTGQAAASAGFRAFLVERDLDYQADIRLRLDMLASTAPVLAAVLARHKTPGEAVGLLKGLVP